MDSFEEWAKTVVNPCFHEWGETVVALGASWDSFKRKSKDAIVDDLVMGGIPILAARDIVDIASSEVAKSQKPMAVFWDLETVPIPSEMSVRDIASSLKTILSQQGDLIQFRGYASIGLDHIPQEKRLDLQVSGCHLVDCPHHGRKEVADKMIIVDAMQFAYQHPDGATLCFITGDVDYAYLLATLQRPQWRTIVVSRGTMQSMLHVNCDVKMRWETDILKPIYEVGGEKLLGITNDANAGGSNESSLSKDLFTPLTADEEWNDDVELLRSVIKRLIQKWGSLAPRESEVGNVLRSTNPARFPQRITIQTFLMEAIEKGVVIERGDGAWKTLCLPFHAGDTQIVPTITLPLSSVCPVPHQQFPPEILEKARDLPIVVFLRKIHSPSGTPLPIKADVQSTGEWILYMFSSHIQAINAVQDSSWLQRGKMVDLGECYFVAPSNRVAPGNYVTPLNNAQEDSVESIEWAETDNSEKAKGIILVLEVLDFFASYDDLYAPIRILEKMIFLRHPNECSSPKLSRSWILEASRQGAIRLFEHFDTNEKHATLPKYFDAVESQLLQPGAIDTSEQEKFVYDLLCETTTGWIDRRDINLLLSEKFGIESPVIRNEVFHNARKNLSFFITRGEYKQVVALSSKEGVAAIIADEDSRVSMKEEDARVDDGSPGDENDEYDDSSAAEDIEAFIVGERCGRHV